MIKKLIVSFLICFSANAVVNDSYVKVTGASNKSLYTAFTDGTIVNPTWVQEVPTGSGTAFAVSQTPISNESVMLFRNKAILEQSTDYTISGKNITLGTTLDASQTLYAIYQR